MNIEIPELDPEELLLLGVAKAMCMSATPGNGTRSTNYLAYCEEYDCSQCWFYAHLNETSLDFADKEGLKQFIKDNPQILKRT